MSNDAEKKQRLLHPDNIWSRFALLITTSVLVARFLTTESPRGLLASPSTWALNQSAPGPVTTLIFAGLLLLAFGCWLIGCVHTSQVVRWPKWLAMPILLMALGTAIAAALAGQKQIATNRAADWIIQWLAFLMLLDLLRIKTYRRVLLAAILASAVLVSAKCIYQVHVELPDMLANYQQNPQDFLKELGTTADSPRAAQLRERILQGQATAFFALGNITASVLILSAMAALGLAIDRVSRIKRKFSIFFGLCMLAAALLMGWAILLTASRGAIVGLVFAVLLFAGYLAVKRLCKRRFPHASLRRHYRTLVVIAMLLLLVSSLAVLTCGATFGSLGPKTLTYRWHYWVGSAGMFAQNPWFGVGPGNFKFHYPAHKLPVAVEEVANPHNPIVQMFTESGLFAGLALITCLAGVFITATRPRTIAVPTVQNDSKLAPRLRPLLWLVLIAICAFALRTAVNIEGPSLLRAVLGRADSQDLALLMLGLIAPLFIWTIGFVLASADSNDLSGKDLPPTPLLQVAIICGLAGFLLHNQITFAIMHGPAGTIFWAFAALAVAAKTANTNQNYHLTKFDRYLVLILLAAGVIMFTVKIFIPVALEQTHLARARRAFISKHPAAEIQTELNLAAQALPCDPFPHAVASITLNREGLLERAINQQRQAVSKNPHSWPSRLDLAQLIAQHAQENNNPQELTSAIESALKALKCYPTSPTIHQSLAEMYSRQRNWPRAVDHYQHALRYDQAKSLDINYQWTLQHRRDVKAKLRAARKR